MSPSPRSLAALLIGLSTLGCGPGAGSSGNELSGVEVTLDDLVPTVAHATWQVDGDGESWLEYGLDDSLAEVTPSQVNVDGQAELTLLGLKAGHSYQVRAVTRLDDGTRLQSAALTVDVPVRADGLPAFDLVVADDGLAQEGGYLLFVIIQQGMSWIAIVDRDGDYVWWHQSPVGTLVATVKLARNGTDIIYGSYDQLQEVDIGQIHRVSLRDGMMVKTRTKLGHHDFEEMPDGSMTWLAYSTADRLMGDELVAVTGDAILQADEGAVEETQIRPVADLLMNWRAPTLGCEHVQDVLGGTGGMDWSHANSLAYDEAQDAFYLMSRHQDALLKIDAASGDVLYEMSPTSDDMRGDPGAMWSHAHFSELTDDGILVFDNQLHQDPGVSGLSHYVLDEERGAYERIWHYEDPLGRQLSILGDLKLLPDGNYLSSWMQVGTIVELTPDQEVAWQLETDVGSSIGRLHWVPDLYDLGVEL